VPQQLTAFLAGLAIDSNAGKTFRQMTSDPEQIEAYLATLDLSDDNKSAIRQSASLKDPTYLDNAVMTEWRQLKSPVRATFSGVAETYYG
jgi:hypothetical protein